MADQPGMGDGSGVGVRRQPSSRSVRDARPLVFGLLAVSGAALLAFGTGSGTVDRAVSNVLAHRVTNLGVAWGSGTDSLYGQARSGGSLHLSALRGQISAGTTIAGDETFWLGTGGGTAGAQSPIFLGTRLTLTLPGSEHGVVTHSYDVVELIPQPAPELITRTGGKLVPQTQGAVPQALARLMTLVVCREVDVGTDSGAPQLIRFLIETPPPPVLPASPMPEHLPRTL